MSRHEISKIFDDGQLETKLIPETTDRPCFMDSKKKIWVRPKSKNKVYWPLQIEMPDPTDPTGATQKWTYLSNGTYNIVYCHGDKVYKIPLKDTDETEAAERAVKVWNAVNPEFPARIFTPKNFPTGWTAPYIKSARNEKNEPIFPTQKEICDVLVDIYLRTGRIVIDAYVANNFKTTMINGHMKVVCVDIGLALKLARGDNNSIISLNFFNDEGKNFHDEVFKKLHQENKGKYAQIVQIIKALLYIELFNLELKYIAELKKNLKLVEKLVEAYDKPSFDVDIDNALLISFEELLEHNPRAKKLSAYGLTEKEVRIHTRNSNLTYAHFDALEYFIQVKKTMSASQFLNTILSKKLPLDALKEMSVLNEPQIQLFLECYPKLQSSDLKMITDFIPEYKKTLYQLTLYFTSTAACKIIKYFNGNLKELDAFECNTEKLLLFIAENMYDLSVLAEIVVYKKGALSSVVEKTYGLKKNFPLEEIKKYLLNEEKFPENEVNLVLASLSDNNVRQKFICNYQYFLPTTKKILWDTIALKRISNINLLSVLEKYRSYVDNNDRSNEYILQALLIHENKNLQINELRKIIGLENFTENHRETLDIVILQFNNDIACKIVNELQSFTTEQFQNFKNNPEALLLFIAENIKNPEILLEIIAHMNANDSRMLHEFSQFDKNTMFEKLLYKIEKNKHCNNNIRLEIAKNKYASPTLLKKMEEETKNPALLKEIENKKKYYAELHSKNKLLQYNKLMIVDQMNRYIKSRITSSTKVTGEKFKLKFFRRACWHDQALTREKVMNAQVLKKNINNSGTLYEVIQYLEQSYEWNRTEQEKRKKQDNGNYGEYLLGCFSMFRGKIPSVKDIKKFKVQPQDNVTFAEKGIKRMVMMKQVRKQMLYVTRWFG